MLGPLALGGSGAALIAIDKDGATLGVGVTSLGLAVAAALIWFVPTLVTPTRDTVVRGQQ